MAPGDDDPGLGCGDLRPCPGRPALAYEYIKVGDEATLVRTITEAHIVNYAGITVLISRDQGLRAASRKPIT